MREVERKGWKDQISPVASRLAQHPEKWLSLFPLISYLKFLSASLRDVHVIFSVHSWRHSSEEPHSNSLALSLTILFLYLTHSRLVVITGEYREMMMKKGTCSSSGATVNFSLQPLGPLLFKNHSCFLLSLSFSPLWVGENKEMIVVGTNSNNNIRRRRKSKWMNERKLMWRCDGASEDRHVNRGVRYGKGKLWFKGGKGESRVVDLCVFTKNMERRRWTKLKGKGTAEHDVSFYRAWGAKK